MALRSMSLILMKDEGRTFKIRFAPQSLVIFLICLLLIPVCLGLSVWLNMHLYAEREDILLKQVQLQAQVDNNAQQIARLISLEQFLDARSPNLLHTLIPRTDVNPKDIQTIGISEEKITKELEDITSQLVANNQISSNSSEENSLSHNLENSQNTSQSLIAETENSQENASNHAQNQDLAEQDKQDLQNTDAQTQMTSEQTDISDTQNTQNPSITLTKTQEIIASHIEEIDLRFVLLEDIHVTANNNTLKINYILRNAGKKSPVSGNQRYALLSMHEGKFTKTPLDNVTDNSFRIKYLKEVDSVARLGSLKVQKGDVLLFEIYEEDQLVYNKIHPIT